MLVTLGLVNASVKLTASYCHCRQQSRWLPAHFDRTGAR